MFKVGDIVRLIGDDDDELIIGVGREGSKIAYMLMGYPNLISGDELKLVRPKVQYYAHGHLYPHPETFTIDSVMIAHDTEQDKDVPMYDLVGDLGQNYIGWNSNICNAFKQITHYFREVIHDIRRR